MENAYIVLVGKPEGKNPLRRPRPRWENHIKMDNIKQVMRVRTGFIWPRI
jgi:hypothetical protein